MPLRSSARAPGERAEASPSAPRDGSLLWGLIDTLDGGLVVVDRELTIVHWNTAMARLTGLARDAACGQNLRRLVRALDTIALPEHLAEALISEVTFSAELASGVSLDVRCVPLRADGGPIIGAAAFLTDVTEHKRRTLIVRAMEAVGRSLTSSLDVNQVLDTIVSKAMELMSADGALVVSWDGAAEFRVLRAAGRLRDRHVSGDPVPVGGGPISRALLEGRPVTTSNILSDPNLWVTPERRAQIEEEGLKAVAAAPLSAKGSIHGALVVDYLSERVLGGEEMQALKR